MTSEYDYANDTKQRKNTMTEAYTIVTKSHSQRWAQAF